MKARLLALLLLPAALHAQTTISPSAGTTGNFTASTGSYILNSGDSLNFTATSGAAVSATAVVTVTINGTLSASANTGNPKAFRFNASSNAVTLNIGATGTIYDKTSSAVFVNNAPGVAIVNNLGTILADNPLSSGYTTNTGQGVDFSNITSGSGTLTNGSATNSTALIQANADDAVKLGSNANVFNYGVILGNGAINDSASNNVFSGTSTTQVGNASRGIEFANGASSGSVTNYATGSITGSQHGVDMGTVTNITVTNYGAITGRNGSGVGGDTATTTGATNVIVNNYGTITGAYAGAGHIIDQAGLASIDGDGDGVDIDGGATITNYAGGTIQGTGAGGYDANGRANKSEGLSLGGGVVVNSGLISGANYGITINNDSNTDGSRSGNTATTITNNAGGTIQGLNGYAIRMENKTGTAADNDTLVNYGTIIGNGTIPDSSSVVLLQSGAVDTSTIGTLNGVTYNATGTNTGSARFILGDGSAIQMGEGDDVLKNYGTIVGNTGKAINMEGGNDTVLIGAGSKIVGTVDGGAGTNTLVVLTPGLTPAKEAALAAGQTVYINGTPYVNFSVFTGSVTTTFSSLSQSPATRGIARFLDNSGTLGANTQTMVASVTQAADPEAAMKQLTPTALLSNTGLSAQVSTQTAEVIGGRLANVRQGGGGGIDISGLQLLDPGLSPAFNDTRTLLAGMDMNRGLLSDTADPSGVRATPISDVLEKRSGLFVTGNAIFGQKGGTSDAPGYNFTTLTAIIGADRRFTPSLTLGAFGGYSHTGTNLDPYGSKTTIQTGLIGAYGSWTRDEWYVNGTVTYGRNAYDNTRMALGTTNISSPDGNMVSVQNAVGRDFKVGHWTLTPEAGYQYTATFIDSFTESGPAALAVDSESTDSLRSHLGGKVGYDFVNRYCRITPSLGASWKHEFLDSNQSVKASFADTPGSDFSTLSQSTGKDFGTVGAGVSANFAEKWTATLGYSFTAGGQDYSAHSITGGIRYSF